MIQAWHYDGQSGVRHEVELRADATGFTLTGAGDEPSSHGWADLVYRGEKADGPVYGHRSISGWQIGISDPVPEELFRHLPKPVKYGGIVDRIGFGPAAMAFTAVSAIVLFVALQAPGWIAPYVPMSWERKLGDAMVGDLGGRVCDEAKSQAVLNALAKRLDSKAHELDIRLANIDMVNAVALPGGKILIFQGLLDEAKSPDELTGVLGHEMGHVRNRDVMQSLLRQVGLSVLLGGFGGDVSGSVNTLISSSYSREAESRADAHSIEAMRRANISANDTAGFFQRLSKMEGEMGKGAKTALGYLASHPLSEEREKKFRQSVRSGASYTPSISAAEWEVMKTGCSRDPDVKKGGGLLF